MHIDPRSQVQYDAVKAWVDAGKKGTVILPTGMGKSFVGVTILGKQMQKGAIQSAMIVVPNKPLIAHWKKELKK